MMTLWLGSWEAKGRRCTTVAVAGKGGGDAAGWRWKEVMGVGGHKMHIFTTNIPTFYA
jgi:hypothetical protein